MNSEFIQNNIPNEKDELLIYHLIVGTFPLQSDAGYDEKLKNYILSSLLHIHSKLNPDEKKEFSNQIIRFIDKIFSPHHTFFFSLSKFLDEIVDYGIINSLAELTIKLTSPGLKVIRNEDMIFDFNPPEKGRIVKITDEQLKNSLLKFSQRTDRIPFINELWNTRRNSEIRHWLIHLLSEQREKQKDLFLEGEYILLKLRGSKSENILAFAREYKGRYFVTIVPLFLYTIAEKETYVDWENTVMELPVVSDWYNPIDEKTYHNVFEIKLKDLLKNFPVACLTKI